MAPSPLVIDTDSPALDSWDVSPLQVTLAHHFCQDIAYIVNNFPLSIYISGLRDRDNVRVSVLLKNSSRLKLTPVNLESMLPMMVLVLV